MLIVTRVSGNPSPRSIMAYPEAYSTQKTHTTRRVIRPAEHRATLEEPRFGEGTM